MKANPVAELSVVRRVLVVDDDEDDRLLVREMLEQSLGDGLETRGADTFEKGLEHLRSGWPQVALVDYRLGARSGLELINAASAEGIEVPTILLTGQGSREIDIEAMTAGAQDYLVKGEISAGMLERVLRYTFERQRHIDELREREERWRMVMREVPAVIWVTDRDLRLTVWQGAALSTIGLHQDQAVGLTMSEVLRTGDADHPAISAQRRALAGASARFRLEWKGRVFDCVVEPLRGTNGHHDERPEGAIGLALDVTELDEADRTLLRRDAVLAAVSQVATSLLRATDWEQNIDQALADLGRATDADQVYLFENRVSERGELEAVPRHSWRAAGDDPWGSRRRNWSYGGPLSSWSERLKTGEAVVADLSTLAAETRQVVGSPGVVSLCLLPIVVAGSWWGFLGFDNCAEKQSWSASELEALRTAAEVLGAAIQRQQAEERLRRQNELLLHSQKMEAVGTLAGGVAHDFNNVLTAISGYAECLVDDLTNDAHKEDCREILRAARRATQLTRQLLAFSRNDFQEPVPVDLNAIVSDTERMLRRLIGSNIALVLELDPDLPRVLGDPSRIEQVIVNLVVNARDAMPRGGRLSITTSRREPAEAGPDLPFGPLVALTVADSGSGIDPTIRERIFEPFFTTKGKDHGTGLGLSTVYGIVQQSGGTIRVHNQDGAVFEVLLPASR